LVACPAPGFVALRQIHAAYRRAPFHAETIALIERCFAFEDMNVARFVTHTITHVCRHLDIGTPIEVSSTISKPTDVHGEDRVLMLNKQFHADHYINPIGGTELYDRDRFRKEGIELSFLKPRAITYPQFDHPFVPFLSIIDVLMFNSIDATRRLLTEYDLV
jgi:WbqC-like protein family.